MNPSKSSESTERPVVRHIPTGGGDLLVLLGTILRIKISSRETLGTFCVCEGRLPPNAFVPLHYHPDVEAFLVLKGTLEVMRMADGKTESVPVATGEMVLIPSNAAHGFRNTSGSHVQLLIIGGPGIEAFLVEAGSPPTRTTGETEAPGSDDFLRMLKIGKRYGQVFLGGR
jgi:mannose-6-phosphate isomerase-like protein (cupin superfamily)